MKEEIEKYVRLMEELHKKARREGREFGFLFCHKQGKLFPSMTTTGGRHAIGKIADCEIFEGKVKGFFHTHPSDLSLSTPSPDDVCYALYKNHEFLCVSGEIPRAINCWIVEKPEDLKKSCEKLVKAKTILEVSKRLTEVQNKMWKYLKLAYSKPIKK